MYKAMKTSAAAGVVGGQGTLGNQDPTDDDLAQFVEPPAAATYELPTAKGTIVPYPEFTPAHIEEQCEELRKAMKGIGTDEERIIGVLTRHSNDQRQELKKAFTQAYGKELMKELHSELSGTFLELVRALMVPARMYDAICLQRAMEGAGTNETWLIELLCPRTNDEIKQIHEAYTERYPKNNLEKDIISETSGVFKRILVSAATGKRESSDNEVDPNRVKKDAKDLYDAGEGMLGTDEEVFNRIFALRSWPHLRAVCDEYVKVAGKDLLRSINREFSYNSKAAFGAIVQYAMHPTEYFVNRLQASLRGSESSHLSLIRLLVSHSETDLAAIKDLYQKKFRVPLESVIKQCSSGDLEKLLLKILNPKANIVG